MIENSNLTPDEAKQALESAAKMENAGWRRAVPQRWFGAGIAILVGSMFAVYAFEDPSPYIVFPIIFLAVFITAAREKGGAYGREAPATKRSLWATVMFAVTLVVLFFGSIYLRRALDAAWVSLVTGTVVALMIFIASEYERRAYLKKVGESEGK